MPGGKGKHLDRPDRDVIDGGIREGLSLREISRRLHVAPSTIGREVRANRTVRPSGRGSGGKACARYNGCERRGDACAKRCGSSLQLCKRCAVGDCARSCGMFEPRTCGKTESWPYVCPPNCAKRRHCGLPKCSYDSKSAQESSERRASESRSGIDLTEEQPEAMVDLVAPLQRKGQSVEAIWATHGGELPVCERTFRKHDAEGLCGMSAMDMPSKVRHEPRKRKGDESRGERVDRAGRRYEDFMSLPEEERMWATQTDTVVGRAGKDRQRLLTPRKPTISFQLYLLIEDGEAASVVKALDALETYLGSPEEFGRLFDPLLPDRGREFDDHEGMERSCLAEGARRCRVYYCDAMQTNQKSPCERNHEELRRILPKGRCDFDALTAWDAALCTSHVNSYPRPGLGGAAPLDLAKSVFPADFLETLGVERIPADEVTLKPSLVGTSVIMKA